MNTTLQPIVDNQSAIPTKVHLPGLSMDNGKVTKRTKHQSPVVFSACVVLSGLLVATLVALLASWSGLTIPLSFVADVFDSGRPVTHVPTATDIAPPVPPDFTKYATCHGKYVANVYNCVDFTNDFAREAAGNGLVTWGVTMGFYSSTEVPKECHTGHAIIITADWKGRYCVVEPQNGSISGSWQQPGGGDPRIPPLVQADMFLRFGDPFKMGYNKLPRSQHTSKNIFLTVFPKGTPVSKDGVAPSGSVTYYP
jgi:hypothetical protein